MKIRRRIHGFAYNINYKSEQYELEKAHKSDAGYDIKADVTSPVTIKSGEFKTIDTGIKKS
jgi:dUTPase